MILFKPEHVPLILDGRKTQTRRLWKKPRVRVGAVHQCFTKPPWMQEKAEPFARVRITGLRWEELACISAEDALREGYADREAYFEAFERIYRVERDDIGLVWVVDFALARAAGEGETG